MRNLFRHSSPEARIPGRHQFDIIASRRDRLVASAARIVAAGRAFEPEDETGLLLWFETVQLAATSESIPDSQAVVGVGSPGHQPIDHRTQNLILAKDIVDIELG